MAEETQQTEEGQKTLVAFVVGLLIGGLLVWAFSGPDAAAPVEEAAEEVTEEISDEVTDGEAESEPSDNTEEVTTDEAVVEEVAVLEVGDGSVVVNNQPASASIELESATYPISEGWIGVRQYNEGNLGFILGVVRFSESLGIVPDEITLQRSTIPGREYAVVIYSENGDPGFNLGEDVQIDAVYDTFTAE
jgi:hypothetical protein